jgi:hypothetical protein
MAQQNYPSYLSLQQIILSLLENGVSQTAPLNNKAFLRELSDALTIIGQLNQREIGQNTKENFALTASRDFLINVFGIEYDTPIKEETSAVLNITIPADPATTIPALTNFTGVTNGVLYYDAASRTESGGVISLQVTARPPNSGETGNLEISDTLNISVNIAGVTSQIATVVSIETIGADAEETAVYRQRILDIIRAPGGGGNLADYRNWSQQTIGVDRTFPFSGLPYDNPSYPGAPPRRTVYVLASITPTNPDGIANSTLLDATEAMIMTDPITGYYREPMTLTSYFLYVESIRRDPVYTNFINATFRAGTEAAVKTAVEAALTQYYFNLENFIVGLDSGDAKDTITSPSISEAVQGVFAANGATVQSITFGFSPTSIVPEFTLEPGQKVKNGGVTWTP